MTPFSASQYMLVGALMFAGVTASWGSGYQFQSLMYILVLLLGGFHVDYSQTLALSALHVLVCFFSGRARAATRKH